MLLEYHSQYTKIGGDQKPLKNGEIPKAIIVGSIIIK